MPLPPEVAFHRALRNFSPEFREVYKGKADPRRLRQHCVAPAELLEAVQTMMNDALRNEKKNVREHFDHDPFHFDYVDSDDANALAFCDAGYSFIGVTIPLLNLLWKSCILVTERPAIRSALGLPESDDWQLRAVLFRIQLFFIASHEYTHVVHGHVRGQGFQIFVDEAFNRERGGLEIQTREADADGYAVYLLLASLLQSDERQRCIDYLKLQTASTEAQNRILLSCFAAAVASFVAMGEPHSLSDEQVLRLEHAPMVARIHFIMQSVLTWCGQNDEALSAWMTPGRFIALVRVVATTTFSSGDGSDGWERQIQYLTSASGVAYMSELEARLTAHVLSHGSHRGPVGEAQEVS
jgi:hypothetical protein